MASAQRREHGRDGATVRPLQRTAHVAKWLVGVALIVVVATLAGCATYPHDYPRPESQAWTLAATIP